MFILLALLWTLAADAQSFWIGQASNGNTRPNANSPIGTNFVEPFTDPSTPENFALNEFKLAGGWFTIAGGADTGEEATLYAHCVDANNYLNVSPATCGTNFGTTFTSVQAVMFADQGASYNYPSGNYVFMWDGPGDATFTFARDTVSTQSCPLTGHPNRVVITSNSPAVGVSITLSALGTGGYPTNMRFVNANAVLPGDVQSTCSVIGTREALLNSGERFDPQFISRMNFYSTLRFMKWMRLQTNTLQHWADRPLESWSFWNEGNLLPSGAQVVGIPYETQIALCNELHANCWLNIPPGADLSFPSSLATLALANLNSSLHVYAEAGNEPFLTANIPNVAATLGLAAYPCSGNASATDPCPFSGTGSVSTSVLTISSTSTNDWFVGAIVSDVSAHTATITSNGTGSGGTGTYNLSNSTLTGTSFTATNPGTRGQQITNWSTLQTVNNNIKWKSVWTGGNASRLTTIFVGQFRNPGFAIFVGAQLDTNWGGVTCSGCSGNIWSSTVQSHFGANDSGASAPYFPESDQFNFGCPHAWTADGDGGVGRCTTAYTPGGIFPASGSAVTTTHTGPDKVNACSVALNVNANHYAATIGGLGTISNGTSIGITFDTATIGPCDDLTVNGGSTGYLQQDNETFVQDDTAQSAPAAISGTTLTITNNLLNFPACCGPQVLVGGIIVLSSVTANTFVTAQGTGMGYSGTYTVNNSQSKTCNPCAITNPLPTGSSGGPWLMVFTNATSAGSMPASWRAPCTSGGTGCFDHSGGWVGQILTDLATDIASWQSNFGLGWVGYEGGMQAQSCCTADELDTLARTMQTGSAMATIYPAYLNGFRAAGANGVFVHFDLIDPPIDHGLVFGTLSSSRQVPSGTTGKFNAAKTYATGTPCWWSGCAIPP